MERYQHILMATENLDSSALGAVSKLGKKSGTKLSLVHTCQNFTQNSDSYLFPSRQTMQKRMLTAIKRKLAKVGKELGVETQNQSIEIGNPNTLLLSKIRHENADLIVIETANSKHGSNTLTKFMLRNAPCDILAVRSS